MSIEEPNWAALSANLRQVQALVYENAVAHGFWPEPLADAREWNQMLIKAGKLMVEAGEVFTAFQENDPLARSKKVPALTQVEEELADCMIICCDIAERLGFDLAQCLRVKHAHNRERPFRHGKAI
jgi:NTP pyrophosphatase (non-canonical NTP hydrolase)